MREYKKVLILTYYWPPAGGPGVQRMLKFVKYLPHYGWQPIVLTVRNGDFVAKDNSLQSDIPSIVSVHRVPTIEFYSLYRWITRKKKEDTIPVGAFMKSKDDRLTDRFAKWIRTNLFIPDGRIGWILPVIYRATKVIKNENVNAIISTSPPPSVHLSAKHIAREFHIPWIADFRDPWTETIFYQELNRIRIMEKLDRYLESQVLKSTDAVLTVSENIAARFKHKYTDIHCEVIPNGYDEADFLNLSELQESNYFKLSFIGNLKTNQNPENLWKALAEVIKEEPSFSTDLRLNFTGSINPDVEKDLGRYNLLPNTTIEKYVPHDKALKKMQSTTILLYIIPDAPDNKGVLTGKLFEYLAAKRPFLSIGPPDGDAATILDETNAGAMFSPEDYLGIKNQIKHLYNLWKSGQVFKLYPDPEKVKKYERKRLTRKLANVLDTLTV